MKKGLKYIIGYSIIGTYIVTMMGFVNVAYNKKYCPAVDIIVRDSINTRFIQQKDIQNILRENNFELITKLPSEINLNELEECVGQHPSIKNCECYFTSNGNIQISVSQRHPIARVLTAKHNFYIDEDGKQMPLSPFYTAHVPIINGAYNASHLDDLFRIASTLQHDEFWGAQVEQIVVLDNGEYALIPRAGRHVIELGGVERLDEKLQNLMALYLQVFNNNSWNKYKTICLKYDGQIVCTKK